MATIPTLLYYFSIFLMIEADSRRGCGTRAGRRSPTPAARGAADASSYGYHFTSLVAHRRLHG